MGMASHSHGVARGLCVARSKPSAASSPGSVPTTYVRTYVEFADGQAGRPVLATSYAALAEKLEEERRGRKRKKPKEETPASGWLVFSS